MSKSILTAVISSVLAIQSIAQEATNFANDADREKALTAIQFMNYLRYVSYEITDYNNVFILEEEYQNLSTDNIALGRIPDEDILQSIKDQLQTLHELRLEDKERERAQSQLLKMKQRRRQDFWVHLAMDLASDALDNSGDIATAPHNPEVQGAIAGKLVKRSAQAYDDYVQIQREIEDAAETSQYRFDVNRMRRLHDDNLKNFDFTVKLIQRYGIDDNLRLAEKDAKALVSCLKSSNKDGVFAQLNVMAKHQPSFTHFPFFWSQYASFAVCSGHPKEALDACGKFETVNKYSLFRRDCLSAQTAMAKIQAMLELGMTSETDRATIKDAILKIAEYNYDSHDYDKAYYCAIIAHSVLNDDNLALEILNGLIAVLERQASDELVEYRDLFTKPRKDQKFESVPMLADLLRCVSLRTSITQDETDDSLQTGLSAVFGNTVVQGVERLFSIGETRRSDLFKKARPEIDAIHLKYESGFFGKDVYTALIPASWFVLGDFKVSLDLLCNTKILETIVDHPDRRNIVFDSTISSKALVKITLPRKSWLDSASGIDGLKLNIPNSSWPISILFRPNGGENMKAVSVSFMGQEFQIAELDSILKTTMAKLEDDAKAEKKGQLDCLAISYPNAAIEPGVQDLVSVEPNGNGLSVEWKKPDDFVGALVVSARFYNEFGVELYKAKNEVQNEAGDSGVLRLECPPEWNDARPPSFVILSCERKPKKEWKFPF